MKEDNKAIKTIIITFVVCNRNNEAPCQLSQVLLLIVMAD
jgi:hypothetical protein